MTTLTINGNAREIDVSADMPLLWVLRDVVGLTGTKFGCGISACGACTVHLDGQPIRSCITPVAAVIGKQITTIEAIGDTPAGKRVQQAWLDLEVVQCGYCQSGQIMAASALLARNPPRSRNAWRGGDSG
jgi:isoquinoline 1-oxidoreductase alpha subunit